MSARSMVQVVGAAVGGLIGWGDDTPVADPASLRPLLADVGITVGPGGLDGAVRRFQAGAGLTVDGVPGPRTVHALVQQARGARDRTAA